MRGGNAQAQIEAAQYGAEQYRHAYNRAKKALQAEREAEKQTPQLSEEEKRLKALAFAAEIGRKYGNAVVTQDAGTGTDGVRNEAGTLPTAAEGVRAGAEEGQKGQKIASSSAAARAPEAAAGGNTSSGSKRPPSPQGEGFPVIPEHLKKKPNKRENEFMLNLMILRNTLRVNAPACRERAKQAGKWTWRDIRLMLRLVDKVQGAMLRTMPASRDDYYAAYAMHGHYELHIDGPVRTPRMLMVTDRNLASLAEAAMKSECIMCMREGSEVNRCALRDALMESAVPTAYQEDGKWKKCEYRDAAGQLIRGEDVTI